MIAKLLMLLNLSWIDAQELERPSLVDSKRNL
jgi:hypothetical protein